MDAYIKYINYLIELIEKFKKTQRGNIDIASNILADEIEKGKLIYVWGPGGHSSIFAEDVMYRKGELASVNPILDPTISLSHGAFKEINGMERVVGLGKVIIKYNRIGKGDVVVFGSAYGINPVLIEAVMECRKIGAKVIGITSSEFSKKSSFVGAMHKSRKVLYELADVYIDSFVPYGDAVVELEGLEEKISPVATIMQLIALKALNAATMEKLLLKGITPKRWVNSLKEGGVETNLSYIDEIWGRAKSM